MYITIPVCTVYMYASIHVCNVCIYLYICTSIYTLCMYTSTSARTLYVCMCTFVFVFALYLCGARIVVMLASCDRAADLIWKQSLLLLVFALYTLFCAVLCCAVCV